MNFLQTPVENFLHGEPQSIHRLGVTPNLCLVIFRVKITCLPENQAPYFAMESLFRGQSAAFEDLHNRLASYIRGRIGNGEFTERGLARVAGISQPQIHNFLKGARRLSPEFADRLMFRFHIGILDLFETQELLEQIALRGVPPPGFGGFKKPAQSETSLRAIGHHFGSGG